MTNNMGDLCHNIAATLSILVTIILSAGVITAILVTNSRIGDVRDDMKELRREFKETMKEITRELTEIHQEIKAVRERKLVS